MDELNDDTIENNNENDNELKRSFRCSKRITRKQTEQQLKETNNLQNDKGDTKTNNALENKSIQTEESNTLEEIKETIFNDLKRELTIFINENISKAFQENEDNINRLDNSQILSEKEQKIKLLEDRLAKKDEIIYLLSHKISISNTQLSSHTKKSPWKPNENILDSIVLNQPSSVGEINVLECETYTGNEIDITERMKSNLDRQLTEIRKAHKETYYKTHFDKITDSSLKSQNSNLDINACEKIICDFKIDTNNSINYNHKEVNNIKRKNVKKVKKKSILILGDSMINGIEESKLSKSRHIRVQPISGAKVDDIRENLDIVINDDLETVVLQIGTNDSTTNSAQDIFNNIMSLKKDIFFFFFFFFV